MKELAYMKRWREQNKDHIRKSGKEYRERNKERIKKYHKQWYNKNRESKIEHATEWKKRNRSKYNQTQRLWMWLYAKKYAKGLGFLCGTGICVFCGEENPFLLENHHVFGRDSDLIISLCANCHHMLHNSAPRKMLKERITPLCLVEN